MASHSIPWAASPADLHRLPRNAVHDMIDSLIQWIDEVDGDPDVEAEGTEDSFDDHNATSGYRGPGCPVADSDSCTAGDDRGSEEGGSDGLPGDSADSEEGGDLELNGDEGDHSGEPNA